MPRLAAMLKQWNITPPVAELVAAFVGYGRSVDCSIDEVADVVPIGRVSEGQFNTILESYGLPVD